MVPTFFCKLVKFYCATFGAIFKVISATVFDLFAFFESNSTFSYVKSEKSLIFEKNQNKVPINCIISKIILYTLIILKLNILYKFLKKKYFYYQFWVNEIFCNFCYFWSILRQNFVKTTNKMTLNSQYFFSWKYTLSSFISRVYISLYYN